jgi:hypothetical protein
MSVHDPTAGWKLYPFEVLPTERGPAKLVPTHYGNLDYEMFGGAGGLSASVVDMARLGAMFSDRDNNPVLNPTSIDKMLTACASAGATLKGPDDGFPPIHPISQLTVSRTQGQVKASMTRGRTAAHPAVTEAPSRVERITAMSND